jgi:lipoprotein-anchoring transpeptidase ErfK/SrfK
VRALRNPRPRARRAKKFAVGLVCFALGGTTAAALSVARQPDAAKASPRPIAASFASPGRIPVSSTAFRQAYAAGLVDRPVKSILNVSGRMQYGDYRWDDKGVPAGPTWIRVDLSAQTLSVFRAGHEIGTAVILYGADSVPTPAGKFPILAKFKDHRSATYDDAPMPYTLRLTGDGVSIHASNVRWGYATHGCIGVPEAFAAKLFAAAAVGDEVLIVGTKARG